MLAQARARAAAAGVELDLREGEMRDLALDEPAAQIYCPFRALLHLPSWAYRRRSFERVTASVRPGGRFAWNAFALDHQFAAAWTVSTSRTRRPGATWPCRRSWAGRTSSPNLITRPATPEILLRHPSTWDWQARLKGWMRMLGPLFGPLGGCMERRICTGMKRCLENTAARPAP